MRLIIVFILLLIGSSAYADRCRDNGWMNPETDIMGIKRSCISGSPMVGWRTTFTRMNTNVFEAEYSVQMQYCWLPWFDTCNSWGSGYTGLYDVNDISNATPPTNVGGKWIYSYHVCLKRFITGDNLLHTNTPYTGKQPLICAYITLINDCNHPFWDWSYSLLGCVNEPINPEPPTFNPSIVTAIEPYVVEDTIDKYINEYYSTFDQPVIKLVLPGATPTGGDATIFLRYKFFGDTTSYPNYPNACGVFAGTSNTMQYCAIVRPELPDKVCACALDRCALKENIGCIARPTPQQSNYAIAAKYVQHYDSANDIFTPAALPMFVRTVTDGTNRRIKYIDGNGASAYYNPTTNGYFVVTADGTLTNTPAALPIYYDKLSLPAYGIAVPVEGDISAQINDALKIREYHTVDGPSGQKIYTKDISPVNEGNQQTYYISFSSIIAEMNNDGTPKKQQVMTPQTRAIIDGCGSYNFLTADNGVPIPFYYIPTGNRDRQYCGPSYCLNKPTWNCPILSNSPCTLLPPYDVMSSDAAAESAVCPGTYLSVKDLNTPEKICVMSEGGWDITTPYDKSCDTMPTKCTAVSLPSEASGYAVWNDLQGGENDNGTCKAEYGFTNQIAYTSTDPAKQSQINALQLLYDRENMNITLAALPDGAQATVVTPTRECIAGAFSGNVTGKCRVVENCNALLGSPAYGNASWAQAPTSNPPATITASTTNNGKVDIQQTVTGNCMAGYVISPQGPPTMSCTTTVNYKDLQDDSYTAIDYSFSRWQMSTIANACVPQ